MLRTTVLMGLSAAIYLGSIQSAAAGTTWLPRWLGGKSDEVAESKHHSAPNAASSKKTTNLFGGISDWFAPKKKQRVVSKYPSTDRVRVRHHKEQDQRPWYSRMFVPAEPSPPKSVSEWMDLEQIKP